MSKEKYLEMCQSLGTDPDIDEMPPDFNDLSNQTKDILEIYMYLKDDWGSMGGYNGKDLSNILQILEIFDVPKADWLLYIELIQFISVEQTSFINKKLKSETRTKQSGKINRARSSNSG